MRVLLVEGNTIEALAVQREFAGRHDVRAVPTLADALALLDQGAWRPELILTDLSLPDAEGVRLLQALQRASPATPVVVSCGGLTDAVRHHVNALNPAGAGDRMVAAAPPLGLAQPLLSPAQRAEIAAEIDRLSREAADAAVTRAIDQLLQRLGLGDEEGLRMAVRLARGWEAAKLRFVSALTTGLATAFLLALGAGMMAMLKHGGSK